MNLRSIAWALFASAEFAVTVLIAAVLYLGGALYFSVRMYVTALSGSLDRAISLWRARVDIPRRKPGTFWN